MICRHFVRVGSLGHVGRFDSVEAVRYPRHSRVICRTHRGLEVGVVLSSSDQLSGAPDGELVRAVTAEDELLLARMEDRRNLAFQACRELLRERGHRADLLDVELLFDGQSLYFYFLGEMTPDLDRLTAELAETYEANVQFRRFTETLIEGCGPACGTREAENGGDRSACGACAAAGACGSRR